MQLYAWSIRVGMEASAWRKTALLVGVVVATLWTILACWRDVRGSTGGLLGRSASGSKLGISATVTPASSVRCNRIKLPARLHNATTGPYNPAAARHPVTGEWLMLHTLDEVRALQLAQDGTLRALSAHQPLQHVRPWSSRKLLTVQPPLVSLLRRHIARLRPRTRLA